jgi:hypothetical protein
LTASAIDAILSGPAYSNRVSAFKKVQVYSAKGVLQKTYAFTLPAKPPAKASQAKAADVLFASIR